MSRFIPINRHRQYLLPPSFDEGLPAKHLARRAIRVIDQLDPSRLAGSCRECGAAVHHPAVLVCGYATGALASRRIERATYDSGAFRSLSADTHPVHGTLANFPKTFLVELEGLFVHVPSSAKAWDGIDLPGELARREVQLKALAEAEARISEREVRQDYEGKVARREAQRQAAVTVETPPIVAATVSQHTNDKPPAEPMPTGIGKLPASLGQPRAMLADACYFSVDNVKACCEQQIEPRARLAMSASTCRWQNAWLRTRRRWKPTMRWSKWTGT